MIVTSGCKTIQLTLYCLHLYICPPYLLYVSCLTVLSLLSSHCQGDGIALEALFYKPIKQGHTFLCSSSAHQQTLPKLIERMEWAHKGLYSLDGCNSFLWIPTSSATMSTHWNKHFWSGLGTPNLSPVEWEVGTQPGILSSSCVCCWSLFIPAST